MFCFSSESCSRVRVSESIAFMWCVSTLSTSERVCVCANDAMTKAWRRRARLERRTTYSISGRRAKAEWTSLYGIEDYSFCSLLNYALSDKKIFPLYSNSTATKFYAITKTTGNGNGNGNGTTNNSGNGSYYYHCNWLCAAYLASPLTSFIHRIVSRTPSVWSEYGKGKNRRISWIFFSRCLLFPFLSALSAASFPSVWHFLRWARYRSTAIYHSPYHLIIKFALFGIIVDANSVIPSQLKGMKFS